MNSSQTLKNRLYNLLYTPMDVSGLAILRMLFGIIIMYEAWRYTDLIRIIAKFTQQDFHFKFRFFEWVEPMSTIAMQWLFIGYFAAGFLIFVGLFYRFATLAATFCIAYIFLVEATNYLNHFYLLIIFSLMMFFIPADRGWSIRAWLFPKSRLEVVPGWAYWVIRFELALVYFYAALAKMNVDWINGMPLSRWIGSRATPDGFEALLDTVPFIFFFTYAGLLYDLLVAPLLLYRKTRAIGYCLSLSFHLTNFYIFNIGIFPWFMIAVTTIFFEPDWPRNFLNFFFKNKFLPLRGPFLPPKNIYTWHKLGLSLFAAHMVFQVFFPLRHFLYPGYVSWTEEGHNYAWHMKLRGKQGKVTFTIRDPDSGKSQKIDPRRYLTNRQMRKMSTRPDLMLQFAHHLRDMYTYQDEKPAEVYAETRVRVNGRKYQRLVDPEVNLSNIKPTFLAKNWVFPVRQPVWNAQHKKNRFGPAFKKDEIAIRAIHKYSSEARKLRHAKNISKK